jgi:potassium efflux system protein
MSISAVQSGSKTCFRGCLLLASLLGLLFIQPVNAQKAAGNARSAPAETAPPTLPAVESITTRIKGLEKRESLDETGRLELGLLRQTLSFIQKKQDAIAQGKAYEESVKSAPSLLQEIERQLARPLEQEPKIPHEGVGLDELTGQLEEARDQLEAARHARAEMDDITTYEAERRHAIPQELAATRTRLDELKQRLAAPGDARQPTQIINLQRWVLLAEQDYLKQRLLELEQEMRSFDGRRDLVRAQKELSERRVLLAERLDSALGSLVSSLQSKEAEKTRQAAEEAAQAMADAHPVVRAIALQNEAYATELAFVSARFQDLGAEKSRVDELLAHWSKEFDGMKEKTARIGLTDAVSLRLRNQLLQLPDIKVHEQQLRLRQQEINHIQLRRMELEDDLLGLVDTKREAARRLAAAGEVETSKSYATVVNATHRGLMAQKTAYLGELIKVYDLFFDTTLVPLHESERQLVTTVRQYHEFIAERILWIQSTRQLSLTDFDRAFDALVWLLDPRSWAKTLWVLLQDVRTNLASAGVPLLLLAIFAGLRRRLRRQLVALGIRGKTISKADFRGTLGAAGLTFLLAGTWPLLLWVIGWRLKIQGDFDFCIAIGAGMQVMAVFLFALELLRVLCRPDGLAEAHFNWHAANLRLVRRHLAWFVPTLLPLTFVVAVTDYQPIEAHSDSLGRLAFILAMLATAFIVWPLFSPTKGVFHRVIQARMGGWLERLQNIWFPLLIAAPLGLALAAAIGYFYTATQLEHRLVKSVVLFLTIAVIHALLLRWLNLTQRELAIAQARKKLFARAKAREQERGAQKSISDEPVAEDVVVTAPASSEPEFEERELDVKAVSGQTRRLLFSLSSLSAVIGLLIVWKEVLPALGILRNVTLWSHTVASVVELEDGVSRTIEALVPVTLADLGMAAIILLITIVVSRNIPGLLEMAVLQRLPFTPSGRYAITSTVRYLIVIVGVMMSFAAIGIGWSKVQFLAAAITVGLGFGLQEIFANFVSGLIILFEQPIRVGDTVTVGNISGKVSRIQIRATTITDWDRKELIIPNKEFVTGQVVNWSLSDTTLRLNMPIGIAYGSDTALAARLLVAIAKEHPVVLKDPEPDAYFTGFGDSTLNFIFRVFIPTPDYRLSVTHDLLQAVDRAFKENNIEIAFPQRDLHIRSVDQAILRQTLHPDAK